MRFDLDSPEGRLAALEALGVIRYNEELAKTTSRETVVATAAGHCPSSDDLRHIAGFRKGGSGSSVNKIMRHAVDAASDGLRLSGA